MFAEAAQAAEPFETWAREELARYKSRPPPVEVGGGWPEQSVEHIFFCITSFRRQQHLKRTLPLNLLALARLRLKVTVVLTTFGEDQDLLQDVLFNCDWALKAGLLVVSSGGTFKAAGPAEHGYWATLPGGYGKLRFWDASRAKNTSHRVALSLLPADLLPEKTLLVNLDCDNLLGNNYARALAEAFSKAAEPFQGGPVPAVTAGSGPLTGRVAVSGRTFAALGGYDDESDTAPSGCLLDF
jgi:hypothetical protein